MADAAAPFSEEDLTRYLQLTLDLFRDLQTSLQPRFHLEMGLLRMVHAGKLQAIEEALAELPGGAQVDLPLVRRERQVRPQIRLSNRAGHRPAPSTPPRTARLAYSAPLPTVPAPVSSRTSESPEAPAALATPLTGGDFRSRLHAALIESRNTNSADAVERSELIESGNELVIVASKMDQMFLKPQDLDAVVKQVAGRPLRIVVKVGEPAAPASASAPRSAPAAALPDDEATNRALENPEVQRFHEMFPDSQVRTVRNLKDRS